MFRCEISIPKSTSVFGCLPLNPGPQNHRALHPKIPPLILQKGGGMFLAAVLNPLIPNPKPLSFFGCLPVNPGPLTPCSFSHKLPLPLPPAAVRNPLNPIPTSPSFFGCLPLKPWTTEPQSHEPDNLVGKDVQSTKSPIMKFTT